MGGVVGEEVRAEVRAVELQVGKRQSRGREASVIREPLTRVSLLHVSVQKVLNALVEEACFCWKMTG